MHQIEIVRFIEVNEHFWSLEAVNYFACIRHWVKAKFQLEGNENKVLISVSSKLTDPLKSAQVKNGWCGDLGAFVFVPAALWLLVSAQPLTEMGFISWGVKAACALGWQLCHLHVSVAWRFWKPEPPGAQRTCPDPCRHGLILRFLPIAY